MGTRKRVPDPILPFASFLQKTTPDLYLALQGIWEYMLVNNFTYPVDKHGPFPLKLRRKKTKNIISSKHIMTSRLKIGTGMDKRSEYDWIREQ